MKITRGQLRRLISEAQHPVDTKSILEAHATIAYFYGYAGQLLIHARRATTPSSFPSRIIGDIEIMLGGLVDEIAMLQAHVTAKVAEITGSKLDKPFLEARAIAQEARDNASFKISESFGDTYAHLLKLAYVGNDVLGTMALVDAGHIVHPGLQMEWRFDGIESQLQNDDYLNVMDDLTSE